MEIMALIIVFYFLYYCGAITCIFDFLWWISGKQAKEDAAAYEEAVELRRLREVEYQKAFKEYQQALHRGEKWAISLNNKQKRKEMENALKNRY